MVGIVTGNGLGLTGSSKDILGLGGQVGASGLGQAGGQVFINAKTGNLVIQQADELLAGRGLDIGVARTYNSGATFDFDNNDSWQISLYRKLSSFVDGASIKRTAGDGTVHTYTYDNAGKYVSAAGSGADDVLVKNADGSWTWTDGDSRITERYQTNPLVAGEWRITGNADRDLNTLAYTYDGNGLITQVRTANGETTKLVYTAGTRRLEQIEILTPTGTTINNTATTRTVRIYYTYETDGGLDRLKSVKVGLTERNDGSNRYYDTTFYETTYTYHGSTNRIASIVNSDGTGLGTVNAQGVRIGITYYEDGNHIGKVRQIIDTAGQLTEFIYADNGATTQVKDALGRTTILSYDGAGNLTSVQGPAGSNQNIGYVYNSRGDLTETTDSRNNKTTYGYDGAGNLTRQQDAAGNIIEYTYNDANQRLTQTTHRVLDPDGAGPQQAVLDVVRYVYDNENHLRFVVSAEGRVTEYEYNAWGQEIVSFVYNNSPDNGGLYSGAAGANWLKPNAAWEADLDAWTQTQVLTKLQRVDTSYDARGLIKRVIRSSATNAVGGSVEDPNDPTRSFTNYIYDPAGRLIKAFDPRGHAAFAANVEADNYATEYFYDGLGRQIKIVQFDAVGTAAQARDANGYINGGTVQTDIEYTGTLANGATVKTTLANGLVKVSTYDVRGLLTGQTERTFGGQTLSTTTHQYDALGRLRITTDPLGQKTYFVYDAADNLTATIDADGSFVENRYNNNGQIVRTIRYAALANMATIVGLFAPVSGIVPNVEIGDTGVRPAGTAGGDRHTYFLYDAAGRLAKIIDASWFVTEYRYDGESQLIESIRYTNALSEDKQNAVRGATAEISPAESFTKPTESGADRRTRSFYSADGLLVGVLDAEGYLIENQYDAAGLRIKTIRYATRVTATGDTVGALRPELLTELSTNTQTERYFYNGQGWLIGHLDAEGYWTKYGYERNGSRILSHRFHNPTVNNAEVLPAPDLTKDLRTETQYDAQGRVTQIVNRPDATYTLYTYDAVGNLLTTTAAAYAAEQRVVTRRYDLQGRLTHELSGEGSEALRVLKAGVHAQPDIDTLWNRYSTRHTYDAAGRRITTTTPDGTGETGRRTVYYYDSDGRMTHRINGLGEVTEYSYDAFGGITKETQYANRLAVALTGGLISTEVRALINGLASTGVDRAIQTSYNVRGGIATTTDAHNVVSWRYYNGFGELDRLVDTNGTNNKLTNHYYDRRGQITSTIEDLARAAERGSSVVYDAFGRVVQATDGLNHSRTTSYDRLGRVVETKDATNAVRRIAYDAFSRILTQTDALNNATSFVYNSTARSVTMTTAEGISTTTTKNRHGETVTIKDGRNATTTYSYNRDGQLTGTVQDSGGLNLTTGNSYDKAGQLFKFTDARGTITEYSYDAAGRVLTRTVDPTGLALVTTYRYDALGQATWVRDARGVWTQTTYDKKGQVTLVAVDPTGLNLRTSYTYDDQGRALTVITGFGTPEARTTQYVYDKFGRRTQEMIVNPAGLNLITRYTYDKADNLVAKTDAGGNVTRYTYDAENRHAFTIDATGAVTRKFYDEQGQLRVSKAYINRLTSTQLSELATLQQNNGMLIASDVANRLDFDDADPVTWYTYDKDGRRAHTVDATGAVTQNFYDATGRVTLSKAYVNRLTAAKLADLVTLQLANGIVTLADVAASVGNDGYRATYHTYDNAGRHAYTIDATGAVTCRFYDKNGQVTVSKAYVEPLDSDELLELARRQRDNGMLIASDIIDPLDFFDADLVTWYTYDNAGRLAYTVDATGAVTRNFYDATGRVTLSKAYVTRLTSVQLGQLVTLQLANGIVTMADVDARVGQSDAGNRATYYVYDNAGRLTFTVDAAGAVTQNFYDANSRVVEIRAYAKPISTIDVHLTSSEVLAALDTAQTTTNYRRTSHAYDMAGRLAVTIDALKYVTSYTYDANGNLLTLTRHASVYTGVLSLTMTLAEIQVKLAEMQAAQDAAGIKNQVTRNTYDRVGRKVTVTTADGRPGEAATTTTTYDAFGNATIVTDPRNKSAYFWFDAAGRNTWQVNPEGYVTRMEYGATGMIGKITRYVNRLTGWPTNGTTAPPPRTANPPTTSGAAPTLLASSADQETFLTHDAVGRQTELKDALNYVEKTEYDAFGNKKTFTNKVGGKFIFTYDKLGRLLTEELPVKVLVDEVLRSVINRYEYDAYGNRTKRIEAEGLPLNTDGTIIGRTTNWTFDKLNRVTKQTGEESVVYDPATNITTKKTPEESRSYDAWGNLIKLVDPNGVIVLSYYDALNRKIADVKPFGAAGVLTEYKYDAAGNLIKERRYNDAVSWPSAAGGSPPTPGRGYRETNYTVDGNGRITRTQVTGMMWVDNKEVVGVLVGEYDGDGHYLAEIKDGADDGGLISTRRYDANGNVILETDAGGHSTYRYYDKLGNKILEAQWAVTAEEMRQGIKRYYLTAWEYDANGNITREIRYANSLSSHPNPNLTTLPAVGANANLDRDTRFKYDEMNRLIEEQSINVASYGGLDTDGKVLNPSSDVITSYIRDRLGNIIQKTDAANAVNNWVYDQQGREIRHEGASYGYLDRSTNQSVPVSPTKDTEYNGLGLVSRSIQRGRVETDDRITEYIYGANGYLVGERDANLVRTTYRTDATGRMTAKWLLRTTGNCEQTKYTYDAAGRQISQVISENGALGVNAEGLQVYAGSIVQTVQTQYNVHGDLTAKRTFKDAIANEDAIANDVWQEKASYDNVGRAWRSNSGDGAFKIYVYDENGNATALIRSETKDLSAVSYGELLGTNSSTGANFLEDYADALLREVSVFDTRNKLVRTLQPTMDSSQASGALGQVLTQTSGKPIVLSNVNPASYAFAGGNAGTANMGVAGGGNVRETVGPTSELINTGFDLHFVKQKRLSITFELPDLSAYGAGQTRIVLKYTFSDRLLQNARNLGFELAETQTERYDNGDRTVTFDRIPIEYFYTYDGVSSLGRVTGITARVYKETSFGSIKISESVRTESPSPDGSPFDNGRVINTATEKRIVVREINTATAEVLMRYRNDASDAGWTTASFWKMTNSAGAVMAGWFVWNWTDTPAGTYDYVFEALSAAGNVLSAAGGSMTLNSADPGRTQTYLPLGNGGVGKVFMGADNKLYFSQLNTAYPAGSEGIAKTALLRYRQYGTTAWLPPTAPIMLQPFGEVNGWFSWTPGLTTGVTYEYLLEVKNGENNTGSIINKIYGTFGAGQAYAAKVTTPKQTKFFEFSGYAAAATTVKFQYRKVGSTGAYTLVTLSLINAEKKATWEPPLDHLGNYEFKYDVLNGSTLLATGAKGTFTVSSSRTADTFTFTDEGRTPTILTFPVPQVEAVKLALYLKVGVDTDGKNIYATTPIMLTRGAGTAVFSWNASTLIPPGSSGTIEYYYNLKKSDDSFVMSRVDPLDPDEDPEEIKVEGRFEVNATDEDEQKVIPWAIRDIDVASISRRQKFNAFGDIIEEIDGRGFITKFNYNTLGKLTEKIDPLVKRTQMSGNVDSITPKTLYSYDKTGRLVATTDGNGNVTRQTMLAGDDRRVAIATDALGKNKTYGYDKFGDLRWSTDELGNITKYTYDDLGRLTKIERPLSSDSYVYDAVGNRISHTNALNKTETTDYDALGRVIETTSFGGGVTHYSYGYKMVSMTIKGIVTSVMGIEKHTYLAYGSGSDDQKHASERTDLFGRLTEREDYSGTRTYDYAYNWAGRLTGQTNTVGVSIRQNITYSYYANGYIRRIYDHTLSRRTSYAYDHDGNRVLEQYEYWGNDAWNSSQASNVTYDGLNRVTRIHDAKADIIYEYDAASNRRRVYSRYHDGLNGKEAIQDYWYTYDKLNRFVITMGTLKSVNNKRERGNGIERGDKGVIIGYDDASRRTSAEYGKSHDVPNSSGVTNPFHESYFYNADGYLTRTDIHMNYNGGTPNGIVRARRTLDALGRTVWLEEITSSNTAKLTRWTKYDNDSQVVEQKEWTKRYKSAVDINGNHLLDDAAAPAANFTTTNVYAVNGTLTKSDTVASGTSTTTTYSYIWWDEAKQSVIKIKASNDNVERWAPGYSKFAYDENGHLKQVVDTANGQQGMARYIDYFTDAQGLILERREYTGGTFADNQVKNPDNLLLHRFYYHDGHRVGDVGNDGDHLKASTQSYAQQLARVKPQSTKDKYKNWKPIASADFDQNYQPINRTYPAPTSSSYTAQAGDTLQGIAASVWGDAAMWYLIADANGLTVDAALTEGQVLTIPNKVTNIHNNASTFKPYNPGEAIGDVNPTLPNPPPPPRGAGCSTITALIAMAIAVAAAVFTAGVAAMAMGVTSATIGGAVTTSVMGIGAATIGGSVAGAVGLAAAAVGGAMGSIVSQGVMVATGMQESFSWSGVAMSAVGAGVGAAMGPTTALGQIGGWQGTAVRAAVGNTITQGVAVAAGIQEKFNWVGVAASAVGATAGHGVSQMIGGGTDPVSMMMRGTVSGMANGAVQSLVAGVSPNWGSIASSAMGSAMESSFVESMKGQTGSVLTDQIVANSDTYAPVSDAEIVEANRRDSVVDSSGSMPVQLRSTSDYMTMDDLAAVVIARNGGRFYAGTGARGGYDGVASAQLGPGASPQEIADLSQRYQASNPTIHTRAISEGTVLNPAAGKVTDFARDRRNEDIQVQAQRRGAATLAAIANTQSGSGITTAQLVSMIQQDGIDQLTGPIDIRRIASQGAAPKPAATLGDYYIGTAETVLGGAYNGVVKIASGFASIPFATDSVDAAVAVQEGMYDLASYRFRSRGSEAIAELLSPVATRIRAGIDTARNYSQSAIGDGSTTVFFALGEAVIETGALLTGTTGVRAAFGGVANRRAQISNLRSVPAETVNASFVDQGFKAPYLSTVRPREFNAAMDLDFVRVHGPTNQSGVWMVRAREIEGMSATQIQSHLGLKYAPTEISPVTVSQGTGMRVGRVGPQPQWGSPNPLGVQYELLDITKATFGASRSLP